MPQIALEEMYPTPWGIVEGRRSEIEAGTYGAFDRILKEEIEKLFLPIERVAKLMDAHPATARKWLNEYRQEPRFIVQDGSMFYHKEDVEEVVEYRKKQKMKKPKVEA